jgi:NAD(P)-dependent dehydrogenase (short-subunit alcohol dehydrogenase family)
MKILEGKVAVITGASRGLGKALAEAYAAEGAKVVLSGRSKGELEKNVAMFESRGFEASAFVCDISVPQQVEALALFAKHTYGHFDIWINNAGIGGPYGPTLDIAPQDFMTVLQTNMFGTYYGSIVAMRHFLPRKSGKLINVLGAGDKGPVANQNPYASSKSWIRVFTLALAKEYKDGGVGVFAFQPGLMDTDLLKEVTTFSDQADRLKRIMPFLIRAIGRQPQVPARKAVWLASSATDGKTGLYIRTGSGLAVLLGFLREGLRQLLRLPVREVDIHTKIIPSAFKPL